VLALACAALAAAAAEQLPIRTYTTADGLPFNDIKRITQDSRSFIWFNAAAGLMRFDGQHFTPHGLEGGQDCSLAIGNIG
jgi:ligand-binding sensor domain-containing protein